MSKRVHDDDDRSYGPQAAHFRAERHNVPGGFVESGTVTHEGREFTSGGAMVTDDRLICYPGVATGGAALPEPTGYVTDWNGQTLGTFRIAGYATIGSNRQGSATTLTCYRVRLLDGREYVGRGLGSGMILKARRAKQS